MTPPLKQLKNPLIFLSLGCGSGLLPKAPGTWGTLAAIPLYLLLSKCSLLFYVLFCVALFVFGIFATQYTSKILGKHDDSRIVLDEVVGFLLTMTAVPSEWKLIVVGFFLFRFFDILKPYPISLVDRKIGEGLGIMLDDVLAALPACFLLHLLLWINIL